MAGEVALPLIYSTIICGTRESTCYTWRCNRWITSLLKPWYAVGVTGGVTVKACTHVIITAGYAVGVTGGVMVKVCTHATAGYAVGMTSCVMAMSKKT